MSEYSITTYIGQDGLGLPGQQTTVDRIHEAVAAGFGRPDFDREDTRYHLQADFVRIARDPDGKVAGFLSARFGKAQEMLPGVDLGDLGEKEVAYLFGTAVRPEAKGNGLYKALASEFITESLARGMDKILFSTQNPHVEAGFDSALQQQGITKFTKVRIPIPGRYGRLLTGEVPTPVRDQAIQGTYEGLRRERGDAFAVVYQLPATNGERRSPF